MNNSIKTIMRSTFKILFYINRRQYRHSLPYHHRRKEHSHYHRRRVPSCRVEHQAGFDNQQEDKPKNQRIQGFGGKDLSGHSCKGWSGKCGAYQEPLTGYYHQSDHAPCHELGGTPNSQGKCWQIKGRGNLPEFVLF